MYWYRDGSALSLLPWLIVMLLVAVAGWLLARHAFRLQRRERLIVGLALGLVLYTWLANLLGQFLPPYPTYIASALLLLALGALFAWKSEAAWFERDDLKIWPWLLVGLGLIWVFALFGKGLALFDEQKNLSLISIIANGDVPPRFFLDYPLNFVYHYGFHVFGASLMRLGGMLPWSAFDVAKAIFWGLSLLLAALLGRRYIGKKWGGIVLPLVLALASGTRYLLLLLPPGLLLRADQEITLIGTSAFINKPFSQALISGWTIDGGPPMPYIFGFLNGIMDPLVMAHQGPNTFSILIFLMLWLLLTRLRDGWAFLLLVPVFAMWALVWESTYALFMLGLFAFAAWAQLRWRTLELPHLKPALYAALLAVPLVFLQGGTLTELARDFIFGIEQPGLFGTVQTTPGAGLGFSPRPAVDILGFSLRWPPAILSAHLGALSLFSPIQLLVGLFELGPVILFTPWIARWAMQRARAGDWPLGALLFSAWIGFLMPVFLQYQADRDISRLSWQALLIWTLMLALMLGDRAFRWRAWLRSSAMLALALMVFGGAVVAGTQMTALSTTQLASRFTELDADVAASIWGDFEFDDQILGPLGNTTILSGQISGQLLGEPPEDRIAGFLQNTPNLDRLIAEGYDYVYLDSRHVDDWPPEFLQELSRDCVTLYYETVDSSGINYRRMLDLRPCHGDNE